MILFSSLPADKDLQFHIVKQARSQSAKEGAGYSEGKEQAKYCRDFTSLMWRAALVSLLAASFIPLRTAVRNSLHLFLIVLSLHILEHDYFLYLGRLDERLCCAHISYCLQDCKNLTPWWLLCWTVSRLN